MSDTSWVLRGVEPEARQKAEEEAARLGVSVADYLADLVVRQAVIDQLGAATANEQTQIEQEDALIFAPPPESSEGFAVRQRLKTLERRLGTTVGSLDGAISALDSSLFDITARVGDVEALAGDTAHALGHTQQEVNNAVAGLQIHLAVVEDNLSAQAQAQEERCAGLDRRVGGIERTASILADAHEALKHAVAEDFTAFTHETADRLNLSLAEVRAAADAAAEQADAAVAHLIEELRGLRASIEDRLEESAQDTRQRMQAAFADAAERMAGLSERVSDNERFIARTAEQLRAQLTDIEDGAQIALEETAHALRDADTALAANLGRATQEQYAVLQGVRSDLAAQIAAVCEEQVAQAGRLKLIDVAVETAIGSVKQLGGALTQSGEDWDQRFDAVIGRVGRGEQQTQALQQKLDADLHRIEASTFAALEKLRRDIGAGDAAAAEQLNAAIDALNEELNEVRNRAVNEVHLLREEHTGALARLTLLDSALTRLEGATITTNARLEEMETATRALDPELERRLAQLEHAAANAESEQALTIVRDDVAALAARVNALSADNWAADRIADLQRRLEAQEAGAGPLNENLQGLARMLNRVAAQNVETAQRAEDRVHQVEVALADLRLEMLSNTENGAAAALQTLAERMTAFELRQHNALETLRADIARFVADNDGRLEALEARAPAAGAGDLAAEFESLRSRIEERVLGVELRSVRTLEQVVDTVALLEQRLLNGGEDSAVETA
jgi:hypothetical protein